ncbi:MAG: hypothetical protein JNL88_06755 [Bacteroidia bacterium]|nr:hypothetical protein [Bacteroidia bacterium]
MKNPVSRILLLHFMIWWMAASASAQTNPGNADESSIPQFRNSILINAPSTAVMNPNSFEFQIRHRFGLMQPDLQLIKDFLGTDLTANIQFRFAFPLGKKMMFGAGRAKYNKTYDVFVKRLILQQREGGPAFALALYGAGAIRSTEFKEVAPNTFFEDGTTPFKNKFNHRLQYTGMLLVSRNFNHLLTLQFSPAFVYRNLAEAGESNYSFAIPIGGSIRTGLSSSLIFEYAYLIRYETENKLHPLSIGIEFGTTGHTFQIIASSTTALTDAETYCSSPSDYDQGEFLLGFNLKRTFWHKKKIMRQQQLHP